MEVPKNTAELLTSLFQQEMSLFICFISSLVFWSCVRQHKTCVCGWNPNFVLCVHNKWSLILQDLFFHENIVFLLLLCFHIKRGKRKEEDIRFFLWWNLSTMTWRQRKRDLNMVYFYERGLSSVPLASMNKMSLAFLGFYWRPIHSTSSTSRREQPWLSGGGCWALLWRLGEAYQWTYEGSVCLLHIHSI